MNAPFIVLSVCAWGVFALFMLLLGRGFSGSNAQVLAIDIIGTIAPLILSLSAFVASRGLKWGAAAYIIAAVDIAVSIAGVMVATMLQSLGKH